MLISRAFWIARRKRKLPSLLPPPSFAAMVISRLARVNAWPRLASTIAFLCLMPAHFEWPDTYWSPPNMLSFILLQAYSNETSFTRLEDVTILQLRLRRRLLAVHAHTALFDKPLCSASRCGECDLDQRADQVVWVRGSAFEDLLWNLAMSESAVEVGLGLRRRRVAMQPLDELASQRSFRVAWFQLQNRLDLSRCQS